MAGMLDMEVSDVAERLRAGFDWWVGELADMAAPLLRPIGRSKTAAHAVHTDGRYVLYRDGVLVGRADPERPIAAALILPDTLSLVRETPAPGLSERDWRRILMDEIDRLTPFSAAEVYAVLAFRGPAEQRTAQLAVTPRRRLDTMLADARAGGVEPTALLARTPDDAAIDLLPAVRAQGGGANRRRWGLWWGVVALLLAANLGAAVWRDVAQTRRLEAAAAAIQPAADRLRRLRSDLNADVGRRDAMVAQREADDPLAVLAALSRALPQGAFADRLTINGASIRLAGRRGLDVDVATALRTAGFRQVRDTALDLAPPAPDAARTEAFDLVFTTAVAPRLH